ncbi:MAG: hypothetical protein QNJ12_14420 [Ilumatobacter sp.]|uniref:hypothetical protein n=1 Tax=Ilumatobacter sp. TaxID=1967498 RepID=UPI00261C8115|nr:hypothetical protein [Ilumatobacter sp.]MDJ0769992.1 hypothetical protein [Ilumatobacter sp.]
MRKLTVPTATLALVLAACSSGAEPLAFDLSRPMQPPPVLFTISGEAADEGVVCSNGTVDDTGLEDMSGNLIDLAAWAQMFDAAMETGSVAEATSVLNVECADGSGSLTITEHVRFDFGVLDVETMGSGRVENGTWTLEGTGDYEDLTGSGELFTDYDEGQIHTIGEIEA